ncbi:MAG TPA: YetF domain-containing protein [Vicinamibacterales bacterium]|nr:YetF domain-containing protein [Vicinamibacterales bacterium]
MALLALVGYVALLTLIRVLGKRTISRMNPSDFAITVALGSTLAMMILSDSVGIASGLVALASLLLLQYGTEWLTTRSAWLRSVIEGEPALIYYRGHFLEHVMRRANVNKGEILKAIRRERLSDPDDVDALVLEIDGTFAVIPKIEGRESSLRDVKRPDEG